jgi:hypothetical protein
MVESEELDPWSLFLYAMKAPMTKNRYKTRVAKFFDFIGLDKEGHTVEEKAKIFVNRGKADTEWAFSSILRFIHFHRERVEKGDHRSYCQKLCKKYQTILRYVR